MEYPSIIRKVRDAGLTCFGDYELSFFPEFRTAADSGFADKLNEGARVEHLIGLDNMNSYIALRPTEGASPVLYLNADSGRVALLGRDLEEFLACLAAGFSPQLLSGDENAYRGYTDLDDADQEDPLELIAGLRRFRNLMGENGIAPRPDGRNALNGARGEYAMPELFKDPAKVALLETLADARVPDGKLRASLTLVLERIREIARRPDVDVLKFNLEEPTPVEILDQLGDNPADMREFYAFSNELEFRYRLKNDLAEGGIRIARPYFPPDQIFSRFKEQDIADAGTDEELLFLDQLQDEFCAYYAKAPNGSTDEARVIAVWHGEGPGHIPTARNLNEYLRLAAACGFAAIWPQCSAADSEKQGKEGARERADEHLRELGFQPEPATIRKQLEEEGLA